MRERSTYEQGKKVSSNKFPIDGEPKIVFPSTDRTGEDVFIKQVFPVAGFFLVVVAAPVGMWEKINKLFFRVKRGEKLVAKDFFQVSKKTREIFESKCSHQVLHRLSENTKKN